MIPKEAIEAACAALNKRDRGNAISIPDVVAMLTAAFAAMPTTPTPSHHVMVTFVAECLRNYAEILRSGQIDNAGHYLPEDIEEAADRMEDGQ